ncbi:ABC transporter permease [Marinobacter adhaerens]|jgi:ABC-2 type transport system permease protein|uniref:Transport permease protein n=2 Tax=Marinobacter adhaerens TaxID=1033846 RepID=A0ABX8IDF7_9GAMM|nr:ABC transporter permease [Marinobacter adhaerens]ADP97115.1 ABC-type multidrug transport system, permease component [Marinobacter adhaerens HP15]MBW3225049.1 ABC transporter permease [Marinobacter adhaerens]MBW4980390.1 ABC transporter permease [Marinobacter adhaerens]QWV11219.1 ABC transporter permease [Marinobacter adhaerens]
MNSLRRIRAIFGKELIQLRRDRMTFGMIVMIPLLQLLLFGYAINTNIRHIPVGIVDFSQSGLSREIVQIVKATQVVEIRSYFESVEKAQAAIASAEVRAVLIIPEDVDNRLARHQSLGFGSPPATDEETSQPIAQWIADGSDTIIASAIKSLRGMPLAELLDRPVNRVTPTFEVTLLYNPEQRTVVNIVPGLVAIILTMTMIMFTSAAIVRERERGNMEMLISTPVRPIELMIGKIIPYIFIGVIQVSIILGLGRVLFHVPVEGGLAQLAGVTFLFITASLTLGLVISTIARNQLQSMQMTVFVLMPSILLSGFVFPYEGMPVAAQYIAEALPATHFMHLVRGVVLRDVEVTNMASDVYWLALFTLGGLLVASLRFKKRLE